MEKDKISVIVPCFNEEESILNMIEALGVLSLEMKEQDFEFVFIDDGSTDNTLQILLDMAKNDLRIKYYSFSRNFGKEAAIYAGLTYATGEFVALVDADMQDPPNLISTMYKIMKKNDCDCVAARRKNRAGEPYFRSLFSRIFYKIINKLADVNIVEGARDFRLMSRKMVAAVLSVSEYNRFSKGIFNWIGFSTKLVEYDNTNRFAGKTKWSIWKLFMYAMDGIVAFSTKPLAIASFSGLLFCFISFILIIVIVVRTIIFGDPVAGWPSLICIISLIGGLQLFCTGIVGQYLAKTYLETKHRPLYIIKSSNVFR